MNTDMLYVHEKVKDIEGDLRVYLLTDLHFGSDAVDYELWKKVKQDIRDHKENARIIIGGDIIECVTKISKGEIYEQKMTIEEQLDFAVSEFEEFKDIISAVVTGNHDLRLKDISSIDGIKYFCRMLGIEKKYLEYEGVYGFSVNKCYYSIQLFHGSGGGGTMATVVNRAKKLRKTNADVVAFGHFHQEISVPFVEYRTDAYNHKLRKCKCWYVCGNTLVQYPNYAKRYNYEERFPSQAVIIFSTNPKKRNIEVEWIRNI